MPFFTQGDDPLDHSNSLNVFRTQAAPAYMKAEWEAQRQHDANVVFVGYIVLGLIAAAAVYGIVLHRRKIANAADIALVSGLATGVRAARKAASAKDAFAARVLAKAEETHPSAD